MAERYNFKYLPLVGKLPGKSMVEQTETAINELASVVYDNVGHVGNLAEEVKTANTNASNALDKATEALETSGRVYIKQIAAVDVNDYYDSELYYINNDGSTNIPVRDRGFLEVKTNDDKTACEQVFIADSTGTPYYRHGRITEQTLGEETTYVVTWGSWYQGATAEYVQAKLQNYLPLSGGRMTGELTNIGSTNIPINIKTTGTDYRDIQIESSDGKHRIAAIRASKTSEGRCEITIGASTTSNAAPTGITISRSTTNIYATAPTPDATDNSQKIATTEFVNAKAGNYLQLSGGTLTGNTLITMGNGESYVRNWDNGLYLGGTNKNNASTLVLFTNSNAEGFQLQAGNGTTFKRMIGKPDGTLTWDNKEIERVNAKGTYGIRFESGIQICWGTLSIPAGTAGREVSDTMTFPYPFANTNYVLTFGNDWLASSSEYYRAEGRDTANFKFTAVGVHTNSHKAFYIAIGYWK